MMLIHSNHLWTRLAMLVVTVVIMLSAGGALLPLNAQEPSPPPQNPPPGETPREGGLDVDVDINGGRSAPVWYAQWWMWAVGLGVFLIVVIALTRGRREA